MKMKKSLIATLSVVAALVVGFGSWFGYNQLASMDSYPTLDATGTSFQGKSVETQFGFQQYDSDDEATYQADETAIFKASPNGIQYYHLDEEKSVEDIMATIQPKDGLKVLFAFYSPGEEELGLEKGFYTYPVGPYETIEITNPGTFIVPAERAFIIISNEDYQFDYDVLKDSKKNAHAFRIKLKDLETGWVLYPLSGPGNLNNPRIEKAFVLNDEGKFVEADDLTNAELGQYSIAWIKIKEKQPGQADDTTDDVDDDATDTTDDAADTAADDDAADDTTVAPAGDIGIQGGLIIDMNIALSPVAIGTFGTVGDNETVPEPQDDAIIKSITYLNSVETASSLINVPSVQFPDYYEGEFINAGSLADSGEQHFMMSAVEIEVGGTNGTVDLNTIEYSTYSQRKNKIGRNWKSWKDSETDGRCLGNHRFLYVLTYENGQFKKTLLAKDHNKNKIFSIDSESDNKESAKLEAGKKYVLLITMLGMDNCAKKFNWEAPLQVKARVRTDFANLQFFSDNTGLVNFNGRKDASEGTVNTIEFAPDDRWVNFVDKSPYS